MSKRKTPQSASSSKASVTGDASIGDMQRTALSDISNVYLNNVRYGNASEELKFMKLDLDNRKSNIIQEMSKRNTPQSASSSNAPVTGHASHWDMQRTALSSIDVRKKNASEARKSRKLLLDSRRSNIAPNKQLSSSDNSRLIAHDEDEQADVENLVKDPFKGISKGGKVDSSINSGNAPFVFRISGQNYHSMGSLLPENGSNPTFSQLYINDTENEISNRQSLFRMARDRFQENPDANLKLHLIGRRQQDGRTYNLLTSSEVAALIVGDIGNIEPRDIIVETQTGRLKHISELHPSYIPLQYPLFYIYGDDCYRVDIPHRDFRSLQKSKRPNCTMREYFAYRIQDRPNTFSLTLNGRRLFQQKLVDIYTMIETKRLNYIRNQQKVLRRESYENLHSLKNTGNQDMSSIGQRGILPSTFTGGSRYMMQNYLDAMAVCRWFGYLDFFMTITCSPEVKRFFNNTTINPEDRPDIMCKLFKVKLDAIIKDLKKGELLGKVQAIVYTVEFQKRGLPHAHICLFMHADHKLPTVDHIDPFILAEIPDKNEDPELYSLVSDHMMHGPCGYDNMNCSCMINRRCSKNFPKKFTPHNSIDSNGYPIYRRRDSGRTVKRSNVDLDNRSAVPYNKTLLKKYQAHINVEWCNQAASIKYLFKYFNKGPDRATVAVIDADNQDDQDQARHEIREYYECQYLSACEAAWRIFAFEVHYNSPSVIRLPFNLPSQQQVMWERRKQGLSIGRIHQVSPSLGEAYFLRILLNKVKGQKSFEDIRTVDGQTFPTFRDACYARGLLDDDTEYIETIKKASASGSGYYLCAFSDQYLSLPESQIKNLTLCEIEKYLLRNNSSLRRFQIMPYPYNDSIASSNNNLIVDELSYDTNNLQNESHSLISSLTNEQRRVFDEIMNAVEANKGGQIVLNIASSGIASLLLSGGRTTHYRFHIPINLNEDSTCSIKPGSDDAHLLKETKLIIWDEAPMIHKYAFEALDRTMTDVLNPNTSINSGILFRGKVIIFGGDFRQVLPVITNGSRQQIVNASLCSSYIWGKCKLLRLTKNMWLTIGAQTSDMEQTKQFAKWLLDIGEGNVGGLNDGEATIDIPDDLLINDSSYPNQSLIDFVYPSILQNIENIDFFRERALLAPTNEDVQEINDRLLSLFPGDEKEYLSSDISAQQKTLLIHCKQIYTHLTC
ncbi:uncharacterized protein LOC143607202 [Bidens hawaiensis]|uniref:uncharacterized protein LOC143607202 n=1 Tax=Bidens hawaiensis TaxID=980011 RepID=UPI00404B9383